MTQRSSFHSRMLASLASAVLTATPAGHGIAAEQNVLTIVHPSSPLPLRDVVSDVYLGRSTAFVPLDLPSSSPLNDEFYRSVVGRDPVQMKALWARIVFTGRGMPPKVVADSAAVVKAVANDPKAIGYIDKAALDKQVKPAPLPD